MGGGASGSDGYAADEDIAPGQCFYSIAVANRTILAHMDPSTYMTHKMFQEAMMSIRTLQLLASGPITGWKDHVPLAPLFHSLISRRCQRGSGCTRHAVAAGVPAQPAVVPVRKQAGEGDAMQHNVAPEVADHESAVVRDALGGEAGIISDHGRIPPSGSQANRDSHPTDGSVEDPSCGDESDGVSMHLSPLSTILFSKEHTAGMEEQVANRPPAAMVQERNKASITLTVFDFSRLEGVKWPMTLL